MKSRKLCSFLVLVLLVLIIIAIISRKNYDPHVYPKILWWTDGFPGIAETVLCGDYICDVMTSKAISNEYRIAAYLFYGSAISFKDLPLPRDSMNTIWGLYHEESPRNVEVFMHEPALQIFNYTSTFSHYSDVPFTLQYLDSLEDITSSEHFIETSKKNKLLGDIAPVLYLQSDCETSTERDLYLEELMKYVDVDSYGSCLTNKQLPMKFQGDFLNKLNDDDFLQFVARYKFTIAIENGVCHDYITEKFWRAIKVGSVPIYFGAPTIKDWLPNKKSAILLEDYPTPVLMSKYILELLKNDTEYEKYLEHKLKKQISNKHLITFYKKIPHQNNALKIAEDFECFVCKKLYEIKEGIVTEQVANKSHYNCPKPISALTLTSNPKNSWVYTWGLAKKKAEQLYDIVMNY